MHARMTKVHGVADWEASVQAVRDTVLPRVLEMDGFRGLIGFVDRDSDTFMTFTLWESEDAMRASETAANQLRREAMQEIGATGEPTVKQFEVAIVELPTPVTV